MIRVRSCILNIAALLLLSVSLAGCELLRREPFSVVSWSPETGILADYASCPIQVDFSAAPDRAFTENAFSLTEDGVALSGDFSWTENSFAFVPVLPLRENRDYVLTLKADACDARGLSLDKDFIVRFTTKTEFSRPVLLSCVPAAGEVLPGEFDPVHLKFSEYMDMVSAMENISIAPSIEGYWRYGEQDDELVFMPLATWKTGGEYEVRIGADLRDLSRNRLGKETRFRFTAGADKDPPRLLSAEAVDGELAVLMSLEQDSPDDEIITENSLWEAKWKLRLVFSEPVRLATLSGKVLGEGCPALTLKTLGESSDAAVFEFSEKPKWDIRCMVKIREGIEDLKGNRSTESGLYRIRTDGTASEPPRIMGLRMPMAPSEAVDKDLALFTLADAWDTLPIDSVRYPVDPAHPTDSFIEIYFKLAAGAEIDLYALMKEFRVEATNGALSFQITAVRTSGFTITDAHPGYESYARAEIAGRLSNEVASGLVSFVIGADFTDSSGNAMAEAFRLPLVK